MYMRPPVLSFSLAITLLLSVWVFLLPATLEAERGGQLVQAEDYIVLQVTDVTGSPLDSIYTLQVFMTNTMSLVAGIEATILLDRPDLVALLDTSVSPIDLTGSAIADWEFVEGRALTPGYLRFVALANMPGGADPPPLDVPDQPHLLFQIPLRRIVASTILDTLTDRTTGIIIRPVSTRFSDPDGNTIGLRDSIVCLDPPFCTLLDTIRVLDNVFIDGSVTIGPSCTVGDVDDNGAIDAGDLVFLVNYVFNSGPQPACAGLAGDVDCAPPVNATDVIYLVNFVFKSGPPPCAT